MLKRSWDKLVKTLRQGTVDFSVRRLSVQETRRYEKLLKEQRRLAEKLSKTFKAFDHKMKKIQSLLGQARSGEIIRTESYIKKLQVELDSALSKAELASAEASDLQREMIDRRQQAKNSPLSGKDERWNLLGAELQSRGLPVSSQLRSDEEALETIEAYSPDELAKTDTDEEVYLSSAILYPQTDGSDQLACDPVHLSSRIKELAHEIELNQQSPWSTDTESLRLAKEISYLNKVLRKTDKLSETQRDRLAFISHD
jgi:hypothetical protein